MPVSEFILVTSGEAGPAGSDGAPGAPGAPGADGADATTVGRHTIWIPAYAMIPALTDGAFQQVSELSNGVMQAVLDFEHSVNQYAQFMIALPKAWDEGAVVAQFFWKSALGAGDVRWGLQGVAIGDGEAMDATFGAGGEVLDTFAAAEQMHVSAETPLITIGGTVAEDKVIAFRVYRDAVDVTDTLTVIAALVGVKLFFTTDADNDD